MTIEQRCDECGGTVTAADEDSFGAAFVAHVRADHADWAQYPDRAVMNYGEALRRLAPVEARRDSIGSVTIEHVTPERLEDFLAFFDHDAFAGNPAWAACYCAEPHCVKRGTAPEDVEAVSWRDRRSTMVDLIGSGVTHGYLAYADGRPAGWVNASRRSDCALYRLNNGEDEEVISISCFAIAPPYRRHGIAEALLQRVIADAASRGVSWIEAYPATDTREGDAPNFRGPPSLYLGHGFEAVGVDGANTVMRRHVE